MRPPRISYAGGVYHVTIRCNNREFNFKGDDDFALYIRVLLEAKAKYDVVSDHFSVGLLPFLGSLA